MQILLLNYGAVHKHVSLHFDYLERVYADSIRLYLSTVRIYI